MTTAPALTARHRPWTHSAAESYRTCPAQQAFYAARADRLPATRQQRLGRILHAGLAAAYAAARTEATEHAETYPRVDGLTMHRYWGAARRALGIAWAAEQCEPVRADANDVVEALTQLLHALPLPRCGEVLAVEEPFDWVTPGGVHVRVVPDLVLRPISRSGVPGMTLIIVDWKSGHLNRGGRRERRDAGSVPQLLRYAAVLAARMPRIEQVVVQLRSLHHPTECSSEPALPSRTAVAVASWERLAAEARADGEHRPRPGEHCNNCPFRAQCPSAWPPATLGLPRDAAGQVLTVSVRR